MDAPDDQEGWHFYVLSDAQRKKILQAAPAQRNMRMPAMWFAAKGHAVHFYVQHELSAQAFVLKQLEKGLERLSQEPRNAEGYIARTPKNEAFLYWITHQITQASKKPTYFSSEYVFAQEFTSHYDEMACYFPAFGRLKQLARLTVLVRLLNGLRESHRMQCQKLNDLLQDASY